MTRLRWPVVALLSLFLSAGAACSSSSGGPAPKAKKDLAKTFKLASAHTLSVDTLRFSVLYDVSGFGQMTGEGFLDLKRGSMSMITYEPSFEPGSPPVKTESRIVGDTFYMLGASFPPLPEGKTWIKHDLATLGDGLGIDFGAIAEQSRNSDVRSQLSFMQVTKSDIEELGTEEIRGTPTTHYKFTVEVAEAVKDLPPEDAELKPFLEGLGVDEYPGEAWIDDEGLIRRISYTINEPVDDNGTTQSTSMSQDFFDFGAKVVVSAPPPSAVVDYEEALDQFYSSR